jgi:hypothetical protein
MSRPIDCTAPLPRTADNCIKELGRITREMAVEYDKWGESQRWREMFDRKEAVKLHLHLLRRRHKDGT